MNLRFHTRPGHDPYITKPLRAARCRHARPAITGSAPGLDYVMLRSYHPVAPDIGQEISTCFQLLSKSTCNLSDACKRCARDLFELRQTRPSSWLFEQRRSFVFREMCSLLIPSTPYSS